MYRIDVDGKQAKKNKTEGLNDCCIRIRSGKKEWMAREVVLNGPSYVLQADYDPSCPDKPFIWIETDGPIEWE